jgi:hypothetical protein
MYDTPRTIEQILALLADAPSRIAGITAGLSPAQLLDAPAPGEWSVRDVLAHLRACSDMWGKYMIQIIHEDRPTIKAVNPTTWIKQTDYLEQDFQPSLQAYTAQRAGLLQVLDPLPPDAWYRAAVVTGGGKPRERTVYDYALWLANHEQTHIRQIDRAVKAMRLSNQAS